MDAGIEEEEKSGYEGQELKDIDSPVVLLYTVFPLGAVLGMPVHGRK